jgi:hypothetical protein
VKEKISMKSAAIVAAALALSAIVMPAEPLPVAKPSGSSQGAQATPAKDFRACREPDTRSACLKRGRGGSIWLELAAIALAMAIGFSVLALDVEL